MAKHTWKKKEKVLQLKRKKKKKKRILIPQVDFSFFSVYNFFPPEKSISFVHSLSHLKKKEY